MSKVKHLLSVFLVLCSSFAIAQEASITGTVLRPDKTPVAGVTVAQKGTNNAAITAEQGTFKLNVSGKNVVLLFTTIGFANQEVPVAAGTTDVSVNLVEDNKQLGEVVVTALGIRRDKRSLAYATQTISSEKIKFFYLYL